MDQISETDHQIVAQMQQLFQQLMTIREDLTYDNFITDQAVMQTVAENLSRIGEASEAVSADFKAYFNSIGWDSLADLKEVLDQEKQPVPEIAWGMLQDDLPYLAQTIDQVVAFLDNANDQED